MTTALDLRSTLATAFVHCRPAGVALFAPDYVRETIAPAAAHGSENGPQRSLPYPEWTYGPDQSESAHTMEFAYLLRAVDGSICAVPGRHRGGVFRRAEWAQAACRSRIAAASVGRVRRSWSLCGGQAG